MVLLMVPTIPERARIMNQVQDRRFTHALPVSVIACVFSDFAIHRHMLRNCSGKRRDGVAERVVVVGVDRPGRLS